MLRIFLLRHKQLFSKIQGVSSKKILRIEPEVALPRTLDASELALHSSLRVAVFRSRSMCRNAPNLCCVFFFYAISSCFLKFRESHQKKILRIEPEVALPRTLAASKLALYSSLLGEAQMRFSATVSLVEFYSFQGKRNKKNVAEVRFLRSIEGDRKTVFVEKIQSAQRARRAFSAKHKSGSLRQFL